MKKGKIILSFAGVACTVAGAFTMKGANKILGHATCYTHGGFYCAKHPACHTVGAGVHVMSCNLTGTLYTTSNCKGSPRTTSYCTSAD